MRPDEHRVDHRRDVRHRRSAGADVPVARHRDHQRVAPPAPRPRDGALRPHRHGVVGHGRRAPHRAARRRSGASARCSSTTRSTSGAGGIHGRGRPRRRTRRDHRQHRRAARARRHVHPRRATRGRRRRRLRTGADVVGIGTHRVPGLRDLRRVQGRDGAVGALRPGRARGPRQGAVGGRDPSRVRRHAGGAARRRAPGGHLPGRGRHRRGGPHRQLAHGRGVGRERSGTRSPTTAMAKPVLLFGEAVGVTTK